MPMLPRTFSLAPPGSTGRTPTQQAAKRFYDSKRWRDLRAQVLREEPLCQLCPGEFRQLATTGHHVEDLIQHPKLGLVRENILAVCSACHSTIHKGSTLPGGLRIPAKPTPRGGV